MNSKEHIENLQEEVEMLKKEILRRDIIIANLAREYDTHKKLRSQFRAILRTMNNNMLGYLSEMKERKVIDLSEKAESLLKNVDPQELSDEETLSKIIKEHDQIIETVQKEPHTVKTIIGEALYFVYDNIRTVFRWLVFLPLRVFRISRKRTA